MNYKLVFFHYEKFFFWPESKSYSELIPKLMIKRNQFSYNDKLYYGNRSTKDLRSVQNIGIISTKFLYFGYLNICLLELLEKNFCRSSLILNLNQ